MDRFEQEAMDLEADIIRNLSERAAPRIAAWGRRCYAEGLAAGRVESEKKLEEAQAARKAKREGRAFSA